jgi:hypothetical protein
MVARTRAAPNQNQSLENFWMIQCQLQRNIAADTDTGDNRFLPADSQHVLRQHGEAGIGCGFVEVAVAS